MASAPPDLDVAEGRITRFHEARERLLAEIHTRPAFPLPVAVIATRIAALSGQDGADRDRAHMAALCERFMRPAPSAKMRAHMLDVGAWQLRWERHSEFSSWTFFRKPGDHRRRENALDHVPLDWVHAIPGPVLVLTSTRVMPMAEGPTDDDETTAESVGSMLLGGMGRLHTDLVADGRGMVWYTLEMARDDPVLTGRVVLALLEIETYRLMALLAFPVAGEASVALRRIEAEAGELAARLESNLGVDDDRALLTRLVGLSGETEALNARTSFRFGAGAAYHEIMLNRIASLREAPLPGRQTLGEFLERRLGPAMRTCEAVATREKGVIDRIARAGQMLNTRVELVQQRLSADLLAEMSRRSLAQLRLQQAVEGLSVVAIAYYIVSLLGYPLAALAKVVPWLDPKVALGVVALPIAAAAWLTLRHVRRRLGTG